MRVVVREVCPGKGLQVVSLLAVIGREMYEVMLVDWIKKLW
jgi:hypothetical protein